MKRFAGLVLALSLVAVGCSRKNDVQHSPALTITKTTMSIIALVENAGASSFAVEGEYAADFRDCLLHSGLKEVKPEEADFVFLANKTPSKKKRYRNEVEAFSVKDMSIEAFKAILEVAPNVDVRLWMPGETDWLIVRREKGIRIKLEQMMDIFAKEELFGDFSIAGFDTLPNVFSSYVGLRENVMPAFGNKLTGSPVAQEFVEHDIVMPDWIDVEGVDEDIRKAALAEIRSAQVVRRVVLKGDICAAKREIDKSVEHWARAFKRNPTDSMLLERLTRLRVNAQTFMKVGNWSMAVKCFETMLAIRPDDVSAAYNLGSALKAMGKNDMAKLVFDKARKLKAASEKGNGK